MLRSGLLLILALLPVAIGVLSGSLVGIGVGVVGGIVACAVAVIRLLDLAGRRRYIVGAGAIAAIAGVVTVLVLLSNNMVVDVYQPEAVLPASAPDRIGVPSFWIGIVCGAPPPTPPPKSLPPGRFWPGNDQLYCFKAGPIFEPHFAVIGMIVALATFAVLNDESHAACVPHRVGGDIPVIGAWLRTIELRTGDFVRRSPIGVQYDDWS